MGAHKSSTSKDRKPPKKTQARLDLSRSQPPLPDATGSRRKIKNIFGETRHLKIIEQIGRLQSTASNKFIVLQKIEIEEESVIEFRLGYYMIGVQPGALGRWVWGQYCLLIPEYDLNEILKEARRKNWFS